MTASGSNTRNDGDNSDNTRDFVPLPSSPVEQDTILSPVHQSDQPQPETDPRDSHEASVSSEEEDDMQILTVRQSGKRPQKTQEIPVANAQPVDHPTRALEKNTEVMAQQNRRIEALERNQCPQ
jgi:hypothetical protein